MGKSLGHGPVRTLVILVGVLTVPGGELHSQWSHVRYGVSLTNAFSVKSPLDFLESVRPGSVVLDASFPLSVRRWWRFEYSFGLIPLAWVRRSIVGDVYPRVRGTSFGVGVSPVGLRTVVGSRRVAVEASISGAVLRYNHPTPAANAAKTNLLGSVSVGIRVQLRGADIRGGYRRSHISNAGRADFNPGIDSAEFYVGIWFP